MAAERGRERSQAEKDVAGEEKEGEADGKGVERQEEKKETQKQRGQAISKLHWPWARPICPHMFLVFLTEHSFPRGFMSHIMLGFL